MTEEEQFCPCPNTYPDWDGESVNLSGVCVHEMKISSILHMPVAYDMYVERQDENIHNLELKERWPGLVLTKTGMFSGRIIRIIEDAQSPSRLVHFIAGDFTLMAELHNGGIGTVPKAAHKMQIAMVEKGCMPKELYLAHLTCEVCQERKGGDKVLMLRRYTANKRIQKNLEVEHQKAEKKAAKVAEKEEQKIVVDAGVEATDEVVSSPDDRDVNKKVEKNKENA